MSDTLTVASRPCASCPYRRDAPSGLWAEDEYIKLLRYDGEIIDQVASGATTTFGCHQRDGHLCAGWLACHGPDNLLAMRLLANDVPKETWNYSTDVPVFRSGAEAAAHGLRDMAKPGTKTRRLMAKLIDKGIARYD